MMKRILPVLLACCLLLATGCASRHASLAEDTSSLFVRQMADSLLAGTFVMDADYMFPQRFSSQGLTSGYAVQVSGTQLHSLLPYRGRAFRSSMEMGKEGPLHFDSCLSAYTVRQDRKSHWLVDFDAPNGQERFHYAFRFAPDGRVRLKVSSPDRDWIVFEGWWREK